MSPPRERRLRIRLPCWIRVGAKELPGTTHNLSPSGLAVRLRGRPDVPFEVGTRAEVRLLPPTGEELTVQVELAWVTRADPAAPSLGLRVVDLTQGARASLYELLEGFRYGVAILDPSPEHDPLHEGLAEEYRILRASEEDEALALLEANEVSVLLVNELLPHMSGFEFLARVDERLPGALMARVVMAEGTAAAPVQRLVAKGKLFGYLRQPVAVDTLQRMVRRAVDWYALVSENERLVGELERVNLRLAEENAYLRQRLVGVAGFEKLVGRSPKVRDLLQRLERVRRTDATVHVVGETGTGKELVARALHEGGPRAKGPFVAQNCAGISEELVHGTLFGHRKGAFTGAIEDREGLFVQAHGGTLFLDEVAELSPSIQAMLLRAVQDGEITPLGATRPTRVDVRLISATHEDLKRAVAEGRFREDLYFRLRVLEVVLPPLRERDGDIPLLATHFLDLSCEREGKNVRGFSPTAMRALERHPWPGNVRELANEVARLVVLAEEGDKIPLDALSERIRGAADPAPRAATGISVPSAGYDPALEHLQRELVTRALDQVGGSVSAAARLLGIERSRLSKLRVRLLEKAR